MFQITIFLFSVLTVNSKVILMIRHSQRAPTQFSEMDAARWVPYSPADLTQIGIDFMISKGARLQLTEFFQIYDSLGNCMVDKIEILSSPKQRTILTAYSFIKGLCPNNFMEVSNYFTSQLSNYSKSQKDLKYILKFDFQNIIQLSNYTRSFEIIPDYLFHGSDTKVCPLIGKISKEIKKSQSYFDKDQYFRSQSSFKRILQYMQEQSPIDAQSNPQNYEVKTASLVDLKLFFGNYKCDIAQLLDVPELQDDDKDLLYEISVYSWYSLKYNNLKQNQASLTPIFEWVIRSIQDKNKTLHIYSGHEANLINVLAVIQDKKLKQVLMTWGADLQFILKKDKIMVALDGKQIKTNFCEKGYVCKVEQAIKFMKKYVVRDVSLQCSL